jgi:hypothetical protein
MPGPPPKPAHQRRRTNAAPALTWLPAEGRQGESPVWPLPRPRKRELELWGRLWATPQAVAWERQGIDLVIARFARLLAAAERRAATAAILGEVRQLEDRLGLTVMSMMRLRWQITDAAWEREEPPDVLDIRDRLRATDE